MDEDLLYKIAVLGRCFLVVSSKGEYCLVKAEYLLPEVGPPFMTFLAFQDFQLVQ